MTAVARHGHVPDGGVSGAAQARSRRGEGVNVGSAERWLSVAVGAGLMLVGLRRRRLPRAVLELVGTTLAYRGLTGRCPVYRAAGADTSGVDRPDMPSLTRDRGIKLERTVTIARPPGDLYRFWRNFETLPKVIPHLESVTAIDSTRSHWIVRATGGKTIQWDAEVVVDRDGELIAWRSVEGADFDHGGSVAFKPAAGDRVYGGVLDKLPLGAAFAKGLTLRMGQTHVHCYLRPLLERIERHEIDPAFVITHRLSLDDAPHAYAMFDAKSDGCIKVVLRPEARS
jgi:uncharacterized membrane protein